MITFCGIWIFVLDSFLLIRKSFYYKRWISEDEEDKSEMMYLNVMKNEDLLFIRNRRKKNLLIGNQNIKKEKIYGKKPSHSLKKIPWKV